MLVPCGDLANFKVPTACRTSGTAGAIAELAFIGESDVC